MPNICKLNLTGQSTGECGGRKLELLTAILKRSSIGRACRYVHLKGPELEAAASSYQLPLDSKLEDDEHSLAVASLNAATNSKARNGCATMIFAVKLQRALS